MRRLLLLLVWLVLGSLLAACTDDDGGSAGDDTSSGQLGLFDWQRDPETIVVRLDSQPDQEDPALLLNRLPPCTLWGDGRLVWLTRTETGSEEVLEARLDDATIRAFLEDIIARGFYSWENELLPPTAENPIVESITVSLYNEVRTVRRFSAWPQSGFTRILEQCQGLSSQPVRVLPEAGWVSAYSVPQDDNLPSWDWPRDAPFSLQELAVSGEARWLEGSLASYVWQVAREDRGTYQALERGTGAYRVAIVVPGYSRDAVSAPADSDGNDAG
jgi:hypothetical protein